MTEYQKTYIELKKQFVATNEGPDSVRALYTFKEELEQSEDQQAKEVLVDVYDLLDFKKDAYELFCQIGNRSDKKTLKRLGTLKDYAENWGNHYALPRPKTPEEKQKEIADKLNISLNTVLTHRKNITAKLGIKTVSGLTFYAIMNGIISGDDIEL